MRFILKIICKVGVLQDSCTVVSIAFLLAQMLLSCSLNAVQCLFYYLNEIPGFNNRNYSETTLKSRSISQKAIKFILFLLSKMNKKRKCETTIEIVQCRNPL